MISSSYRKEALAVLRDTNEGGRRDSAPSEADLEHRHSDRP